MKWLRKNFFNMRRWLVRLLIGECTVMANVDFLGKAVVRGPFLLSENCVALGSTWQPGEFEPDRMPMGEPARRPGN